jgi:hypothetical protein
LSTLNFSTINLNPSFYKMEEEEVEKKDNFKEGKDKVFKKE